MRILWITNIVFPEAQQLLHKDKSLRASGGWMLGLASALLSRPEIELYVASVSQDAKTLRCLKGEKITYYLIPKGRGNIRENHDYELFWNKIENEVRPDVTHIHGTEYSHGLSYIKACRNTHAVISIQGLTSVYAKYYFANISLQNIRRNTTIRDIIRRGIILGQRQFVQRGEIEKQMLQSVGHIIGRTSWDKAHTWAINPKATYHFCNEALRPSFYSGQWTYENCIPHTIFVSQASYPIKGLHQLLLALPLILRSYPDTQIRVAGIDICKHSSVQERIRRSGYGKYIQSIIDQYTLGSHVHFTGPLDEMQMKEEFLKTNLFVLPSSIENSPNSLGEAQLLGVPCLASYVGGVPDMIPDYECGEMYRFDEIEMLAQKVCKLFANTPNWNNSHMQDIAKQRHNVESIANQMIAIYKEIAE